MAKLTGTNPEQVPTNADLGTMAYQDATDVKLGSLNVTDGTRVALKTDKDLYTTVSVGVRPNNDGHSSLSFDAGQAQSIKIEGTSSGTLDFFTNSSKRISITSSGEVQITNELTATSYNETYSALSGTTPTVNCEAGNSFSLTLSGNTTFTFSNPPASGTSYTFSIEIIQDSGASGYTVTWPSSVDWPAATAPTLTATASAKDIFVFTTRDGGTTWYGFTAGQALA